MSEENPFPGSSAYFYERLAEKDAEIERLEKKLIRLLYFVSACRYAGPDGLETLKTEATILYGEI